MATTDTNPFLCKQFEIWKLKAPLGKELPILFVLVISKTDTLNFHKEPYFTALPLYPALFQGQMLPQQVQLPFIRGGQDSLHDLPFDCLVGTHALVTLDKRNLLHKVAYLNEEIQKQTQKQIRERLAL